MSNHRTNPNRPEPLFFHCIHRLPLEMSGVASLELVRYR